MTRARITAVVTEWSPETRRLVAEQVAFKMSGAYAEDTTAQVRAFARLVACCQALGGDLDFDDVLTEVRRRQGLGMTPRAAAESVAGDLAAGRWIP